MVYYAFNYVYILRFLAPSLWYISISLSILWESFEYYIEKKNLSKVIKVNGNDFIINTIGLIIGVIANIIWKKYKKSPVEKKEDEDEEKLQENNPKPLKIIKMIYSDGVLEPAFSDTFGLAPALFSMGCHFQLELDPKLGLDYLVNLQL